MAYQRGSAVGERQARRQKVAQLALEDSAKGLQPLTAWLIPCAAAGPSVPPAPPFPPSNSLEASIADLQRRLDSRTVNLLGQDKKRHDAVLRFMQLQETNEKRQTKSTRAAMSQIVAGCFGRGACFAERIVAWERTWRAEREIQESRQGLHPKVMSWFHDEGVMLAVREYLAGAKDGTY